MSTRCPACGSDRHEPVIDGATGRPALTEGHADLRCTACGETWLSRRRAQPSARGGIASAFIVLMLIGYGAWGLWEAYSGKASRHVGGFFAFGRLIDVSGGEAVVVGIQKALTAVTWMLVLSVVMECVSIGGTRVQDKLRDVAQSHWWRGFRFSAGSGWSESGTARPPPGETYATSRVPLKAIAAALTLLAASLILAAREIAVREARVELGPYEYHRVATDGEALLRACITATQGVFWSAFALVGLSALCGRGIGVKWTAFVLAVPTALHSLLCLVLCTTRLQSPKEHFSYVGYLSGVPAVLAVLCDIAHGVAWLLLAAALLAATVPRRIPWMRFALTGVIFLFAYGIGAALLHWVVRFRSAVL